MFLKTNLSISSSKNVLGPEQKVFLDYIFLAETNNLSWMFSQMKKIIKAKLCSSGDWDWRENLYPLVPLGLRTYTFIYFIFDIYFYIN